MVIVRQRCAQCGCLDADLLKVDRQPGADIFHYACRSCCAVWIEAERRRGRQRRRRRLSPTHSATNSCPDCKCEGSVYRVRPHGHAALLIYLRCLSCALEWTVERPLSPPSSAS
jgi:hypothetical protein